MKIPHFDKRDGQKDSHFGFKGIREILGLPWNRGLSRAIEGCKLDHKKELSRLKREAKKKNEKILATIFHNYAAEILVES
jgi:hypothetical protein